MGLIPTEPYETLLANCLYSLLGRKLATPEAYADALNEKNLRGPAGQQWTAALFVAEMERLGGGPSTAPRPSSTDPRRAVPPRLTVDPVPAEPRSVDEVMARGLMDMWYLVARSEDVADRPLAIRRLSRNLVLWRGNGGEVKAVEDYCPHRGAPLSMGYVVDGDVTCPYHGLQLNGEGIVTAMPPQPGCGMVGEKAVVPYRCREAGGGIWVYFGDASQAEPPEPPLPEELASDEWTSFIFADEWLCNWQHPLDNRVDPVHGSFLHTGTFTLGRGARESTLQITETPLGFETERTNQRGVNIDWHEVVFQPGNIAWVRTEIPYPEAVGGGSFRIVGMTTPIDEDATYFWVARARKLSGWQRNLWRVLYKSHFEASSNEVVEQDRVLLETMPLATRRRERLVQPDIAVVRLRRMARAEAERQFARRKPGVIAAE